MDSSYYVSKGDEHKVKLEDLYKRLNSNENGLSNNEAIKRLSLQGNNELKEKKQIPVIFKFLKNFTNFFAILLIFGAILAFTAEFLDPGQGNFYIGIALSAVVVLNAVFTFIQEYQSEKIMASFKNMIPNKITVLRDNKKITILTKDLVPGDIIFLEEGDKIPADCRLIQQNNLKVDNSPITGESEPQLRKTEFTHENILESRNMVFSGTLVQTGNGVAIVYGTGMDTQIGKIAELTEETKNVQTPLHKEINRFIKIISGIAIFLGVLFFIVSLIIGKQYIGSIIFAIGIIVANVPEGLLPTVTLSLSIASKKMAKKNALIKKLESVETLGSTTVICTDKTGTLTQNKISVKTIFMNLEEKDILEKKIKETKGFDKLIEIMVLCNNSRKDSSDTGKYHGDPTEIALLDFADDYYDLDNIISNNKRVHESPFDSVTKRMITTNMIAKKRMKETKVAHLKGAPEEVIKKCSKVLINGKVISLTKESRENIINYNKKLSSRGERVLACAYKETNSTKALEKDFIFVSLVGMIDPPRQEVPEAIMKCKEAGIKVIMVTGDYSLTAEAIARSVGLVNGNANIMTGEELDKVSDDKLREFLRKDNLIFARAAPIQKLRIVKCLQDNGEVVTVTGDGVNDAPALKNADMGVSMGIGGTEVAREASDMVLLDDNFATIVNAVEEGRTIFENIKKFIAYILTSNVPEILPFIAFVLLQIPLPLTVVLILAIDLGTDILPALGLGSEKPELDVMKRPPRRKDEKLLTSKLLFMSYGIIGMIQAAAGFFAYFYVLFNGGWIWGMELAFNDPLYLKAISAFFVAIVICQIPDVLICRARRQSIFKVGLFSNKLVLFGIFMSLVLTSLILYVPILNKVFGTAPLSLTEWLLPIPFALLILFGDELRKIFVKKSKLVEKYLTW